MIKLHIYLFMLTGWPGNVSYAQEMPKQWAITGVVIIDARHTQPAGRQTVVIKNGMDRYAYTPGNRPFRNR